MLQGIDPVIIFQLYKLTPAASSTLAAIPLTSGAKTKTTFAVIPIYLSANLTGIQIDSESKNIDIDTDNIGTTNGEPSPIQQRPIGSVTTINLKARQGSVGMTILLALAELLLDKIVSQEYEITYCHGGITVFGGLIHSFSYDQGTEDDLYKIKIELSRGRPKSKSVPVEQDPNALRLGDTGAIPSISSSEAVSAPAVGDSGYSFIQPNIGNSKP